MNNIPTLRWLVSFCVTLCFSAMQHAAYAQCSIASPPEPVQLQLILNPVNGTADLLQNTVSPYISGSGAAGCNATANIRFFYDADKTLPTPLGLTSIPYDCTDANTTQSVYVAVSSNANPTLFSEAVNFDITILDYTAPTIASIGNFSFNTDPGLCTASNLAGIDLLAVPKTFPQTLNPREYTDNCLGNLLVSYSLSGATTLAETLGSDAGVETFNPGVTTVTYFVEDAEFTGPGSGQVSTSFTVTISDNENPVITCPANLNVSMDPGVCEYAYAGGAATATDNCGNPNIENDVNNTASLSGEIFFSGATVVIWTATDGSGNTHTCQQTITVSDNEEPTISCPPSVVLPADDFSCDYTAGALNPGEFDASGADNCGVVSLNNDYNGLASLDGEAFLQGAPYTITWTATDGDGNTATCTFSVTVQDSTPPFVNLFFPSAISYSDLITVNAASGNCSQSVSWYRPSVQTHDYADFCNFPVILTEGIPVVNGVPDPNFLVSVTPFPYDPDNFLHQITTVTAIFPVGVTRIPYIFTDGVGNADTIYIQVTVLENQPPVANCVPGVITAVLDASGNVKVTAAQVNNGSVDNCEIASLFLNDSTFTCLDAPGAGFPVTLTVTDLSGLTATCTSVIDVVDNTPPSAQCPTNKTVSATMGCDAFGVPGVAVQFVPNITGPGQYTDNCGISSVSWTITNGLNVSNGIDNTIPITGIPNTQGFAFGTNIVTYTFTGANGNSTSCSFTVNVEDQAGPSFSGGPAPTITTSVTNGCIKQVNWTPPVVSDACAGVATVTSTHAPNSFFFFGTTLVTYTAIDNAGNVSTYTFNVVVNDAQSPVAQCKNISVPLNAAGTASITAQQIDNNSFDNCTYSYVTPNYNFTCSNLGPNTVTLTIVDGSGNPASCNAIVTVVDNIAPVAVCSTTDTVNLNSSGNFVLSAATLNNGSSDNCASSLTYRLSVDGGVFVDNFTFNCSNLGLRQVALRATDGGGNSDTCQQTILVRDVTAPTFTPPAGVNISCNAPFDPGSTGTVTNATDACDATPTITSSDAILAGACVNAKTIIRTWRVTDDSGNTATATQLISISDNAAPSFPGLQSMIMINANTNAPTCSGDLSLSLTANTLTDNCSDFANITVTYTIDYPTPSYGFTDVSMPVAGKVIPSNTWPIGNTQVVWRAVDQCGNSSSFVQVISVKDVQGPAFEAAYTQCGKQIVVPNTLGACSNIYSWIRPSRLDTTITDCLNFTVTETISNATVQQSINVSNPFNYNGNLFQSFATAQFPVGITTVTYTATDAGNTSSTCTFTVEVQDVQPPVLTCPGAQILNATCPSALVPDYRNLVLINDNCPASVQLMQTPAIGATLGSLFSPNLPASGNTFNVTIQAMDGYNMNTCTFQVTLQDGDAPIPTVAVLPSIIDSCGGFIIDAPTATDPCNPNAPVIYGTPSTPVGMFIPGTPPKYNLTPGLFVITWVYDDGNGNVSTQPQNIQVLPDIFPPAALCKPNLSVNLSAGGTATILISDIDNGSNDPNDCGPITISLDTTSFSCDDIGVNVVTLTVTDHKNNTATCTTPVTVHDVTAPVLSPAPADEFLEACDTIPEADILTAIDACDNDVDIELLEISTQDTIGFNKYNYTITRIWTAMDNAGNTATAEQVIFVEDTEAPVFDPAVPDTIIVQTDAFDLSCSDTVDIQLSQYIADCAGGDDLIFLNSADPLQGADLVGIFDIGVYDIVFGAEDVSGNLSTHTVTVIVEDKTPPTAICINGVSAALQPSGEVVVTTAQFNNNSYDNCTPTNQLDLTIQRLDELPLNAPTATIKYDCSDADGVTQHPLKLYVRDEYGNLSTCETYIVIQDNVAPTITFCPPSKTVQCTDDLAPSVQGTAIGSDNCSVQTPSFEDEIAADTTGNCLIVTRTWKITDQAGNMSTCNQVFSIQDTVKPVLSAYPMDVTISCSENLAPPSVITATDNCSNDLIVTLQEDTIPAVAGPCGDYSYIITRTRSVTDDCGNTETHSRTITVLDNEEPKFLGLPDTLIAYSADFPNNNNCLVPVNLNVGQYLFDCQPDSSLLVSNDAPQGDGKLSISGDYPIGEYQVYFVANDACGNLGVDSVHLIVIDNSLPTVICNDNVVIALGTDGLATIEPDDIDLGSNDNCGIDSTWLSKTEFSCLELGVNPIQLFVRDISGNVNFCNVEVEVEFGLNAGFTLTASGSPESYFGADDGSAFAEATGGSGNFDYTWSNAGSGQSIGNLAAGTYTVTVVDLDNGCVAVDTAIVDEGAKITLTAGVADGCQNDTILVPITVDNFTAITGFTFTISLSNAFLGTVVGAANPVSGLVASPLNAQDLGVLWTAPGGMPLDLPNGTKLFDLQVLLSTAAISTTSLVQIGDMPVSFEFNQDSAGFDIALGLDDVDVVNGSASITCAFTDIEIGGDIQTWRVPVKPVPNVTVILSGGLMDTLITPSDGTYLFSVPQNTNTTVSCTKETPGNDGITAADLLFIENHIFGNLLPSPYQWVAADANNDGNITLNDKLRIQRVSLGTDDHILGSPDWKFIPKSYTFPTPNALSLPYPQSISHTPAVMDYLDDDFVAVRMGDVNGNITPSFAGDDSDDRSTGTLYFRIDEQMIQQGELISVPFKSADFKNRHSYQMTIEFDPSVLELSDVRMGALPKLSMENFGTTQVSEGRLTTVWVSLDPVSLNDNETLFTLEFRSLKNGGSLSGNLHAGSSVTLAKSYDLTGAVLDVDFEFVQPTDGAVSKTFALYQNQPNPFKGMTNIGFRLPESGRATLRIFSASGQLVKTYIGNFNEGYNELMFRQDELGEPGVYWYELETAKHSDRKKMVLMN